MVVGINLRIIVAASNKLKGVVSNNPRMAGNGLVTTLSIAHAHSMQSVTNLMPVNN